MGEESAMQVESTRKRHVERFWNYFETGHGKGEHDGAGACVKTAL